MVEITMKFLFWMRFLREKLRSNVKRILNLLGIAKYIGSENFRSQPVSSIFDTAEKFDSDFLNSVQPTDHGKILKLFEKSHSQIRQDLFVLHVLNFKKNGFFVEFGATNGFDLNNTYLLEKDFAWNGILAEPGRVWRNELRKNRPNAIIEERLIWKDSNSVLLFNETPMAEFSTIDLLSNRDAHRGHRENGAKYRVETISLNDMLELHNAPFVIDYLSIDTEGSEYEILSCLDFEKYSFRVITCEHNYSKQRKLIYRLLTKHGYKRMYEEISLFDDWYVKADFEL
jgi:FkbM family methyltransferase